MMTELDSFTAIIEAGRDSQEISPAVNMFAAVLINQMIDHPLQKFQCLHVFGRVALVHYVPTPILDPVAPVLLIEDLPDSIRVHLSEYYRHLMNWRPRFSPTQSREWALLAQRIVDSVIRKSLILEGRGTLGLSNEEWEYFRFALRVAVAFPDTGGRLLRGMEY